LVPKGTFAFTSRGSAGSPLNVRVESDSGHLRETFRRVRELPRREDEFGPTSAALTKLVIKDYLTQRGGTLNKYDRQNVARHP